MSDFVVVSLVLRCKLEGWIFSTLSYSIQQNMMILSFDACIPFKLIIYFAVHFSSIEWNSMELFKQKYRTEKKGIAFVCQKRATKNFIFIKQNKEFASFHPAQQCWNFSLLLLLLFLFFAALGKMNCVSKVFPN